ncbi:helix-turn-helix transcriptional regulator [bacterium]|nr:helix-turn-helix transcriptional regulator [bacterium]
MSNIKKLGKNLRKLRKSKGLSQEELSLNLDFDGSYIGKVENGKLNITLDKLINIAEYFQIDIIELLK